jgi:hypothetical protein
MRFLRHFLFIVLDKIIESLLVLAWYMGRHISLPHRNARRCHAIKPRLETAWFWLWAHAEANEASSHPAEIISLTASI